MVGGEHQLVAQDRFGGPAGQVEIAVVGKVDRRGLVGGCRVLDLELVFVGHGEGNAHRQVPRIAFLAVGAAVGHLDRYRVVGPEWLFGLPDDLVKPLDPAVQRVGAVVGGQRILVPAQGEFPLGDPVGHPSHRGAEVGLLGEVSFQVIESEDDVAEFAVAVGGIDLGDRSLRRS